MESSRGLTGFGEFPPAKETHGFDPLVYVIMYVCMYGVLFWVDVAVAFTTINQNLLHGVFHTEKLSQSILNISNIPILKC
jgi:hypothetical protein